MFMLYNYLYKEHVMESELKKKESIFGWLASARGKYLPFKRPRRAENLFDARSAGHMLVGCEKDTPFDSDAYIFEPLFEGQRIFAYVSDDETVLIGRHGKLLTQNFPELKNIHAAVAGDCILDGEIIVPGQDVPDSKQAVSRALLTDTARIRRASRDYPAVFVAGDIIYCSQGQITDLPILDRKEILEASVTENRSIVLSRYLRGTGIRMFTTARRKSLNGILAKHKNSEYHLGRKSPDWIEVRRFLEDTYIVCGFVHDPDGSGKFVLGQLDPTGVILYRGTVGVSEHETAFVAARQQHSRAEHPFVQSPSLESAPVAWLAPALVCSVSFKARDEKGMLTEPKFLKLCLGMAWEEAMVEDGGSLDACAWAMTPWN